MLILAGKPLIAHTIEHARGATSVGRTFVSTDDEEIASISRFYGAEVVMRPKDLASDTAPSELALIATLDYLSATEHVYPDLVVFLQCTSPVRDPSDIDKAVRTLLDQDADSLLSATRSHAFSWRRVQSQWSSVNYDYQQRQRRQDMPEEFVENGSIYVLKPWVLQKFQNRLGGKIALYEMGYWSSFQIDSEEDLSLCEWVLQHESRKASLNKLPSSIKAIVFDFDGVFTDNRVLVSQDGSESVLCNRSDGLGISRLKEVGLPIIVLSTEENPIVAARCKKLGLEFHQEVSDKLATLRSLAQRLGTSLRNIIYVGNDINDLECIKAVGCGIAVADSSDQVIRAAKVTLASKGGEGAVREVCDLVIEGLGFRP